VDHLRRYLVEGVICALSLIVWSLTAPGTWVNEWAYKWVLITSITGVLLNLNPLMKFDGYYALCQALKVDNLREDSFAYLGQWVRHYLSWGRKPVDRVGRRTHRIFLIYASLANLYTAAVLLAVLVWAKNVATNAFGFWGWVLIGGFVWLLVRKRVAGGLRSIRNWVQTGKETVMRWRQSWRASVVAGAAVLLVVVPTTPTRVTTEFVLEPGDQAKVRASVPGLIQEIRVKEGARVKQGMLLAVLDNAEIEAQEKILEQELQLAAQALRAAQAGGDLAESQQYGREQERLSKEWRQARQKRANLLLRAPLDGLVTTPQIEQRVGEYLHEGQALCTVVNRSRMKARVLVRDSDLGEIQPGARVKLKVRPYPMETFVGRVEQILPAAAADRPVAQPVKGERHGQELFNYFALTLEFPTPEERLREGMTGTAKIYGPRRPRSTARAPAWLGAPPAVSGAGGGRRCGSDQIRLGGYSRSCVKVAPDV
jgi:putative peptide zinc metalloprotease protein